MHPSYSTSIQNLIERLPSLQAIPTGVKVKLDKKKPVKAVVFDIYGTLLISSSGDIHQVELKEDHLKQALKAGHFQLAADAPEDVLREILEEMTAEVGRCHQRAKQAGNHFPEVEMLSVWQETLHKFSAKNQIIVNGDTSIWHMAFTFEMLANPACPMPDMKPVLMQLYQKCPLGIVSNAQFYTPVIMHYFLTGRLSEHLKELPFFDQDLTVYSFEELKGKPSVELFDKVVRNLLKKYGIRPEEALFVGNDMLNDMYTASCAGLQTALFAGDKRSLRLRGDRKEIDTLQVDYVVTELKQLVHLL